MLCIDNIIFECECQGFKATNIQISDDQEQSAIFFESTHKTKEVRCPECGGDVYIHGVHNTHLTDIPIWHGINNQFVFFGYRYKCQSCGKTFVKEVPFQYPGTRITDRAANWIKGYLRNNVSIRSIQNLTGIHWETIRNIQKKYIKEELEARELEHKEKQYRPRFLAVDEFAIHKGHSYATSVMDLESGEVLWVGKGRTLADFDRFFKETDPSFLAGVIAVAMDMNASYNKLVSKYLPKASIVYDRYHMQAQYSREVLGVVRLEEARKHNVEPKEMLNNITQEMTKEEKREIKAMAKSQMKEYSALKKSRWTLLMNRENLSDERDSHLQTILDNHHDLAVCYAMKEEMCDLFKLTDPAVVEKGWINWFSVARSSGIPALVKFAELKEKRLPGLIAHASFPISTSKLEGFNNKIKVVKRIGFGYRDDDFFFSLIRFISIPSFHTFP